MQLEQAVKLIQHKIKNEQTIYADLGCGDGLFTYALSQMLAPASIIYAVDKNKKALSRVSVDDNVQLEKINADFIKVDLPLENLSGILMANSLHYVKDKNAFLLKAKAMLANDGYFILIEYDNARANPWVPYPIKFSALQDVFDEVGLLLLKNCKRILRVTRV